MFPLELAPSIPLVPPKVVLALQHQEASTVDNIQLEERPSFFI